MPVSCDCSVLSGKDLYVSLITHLEEASQCGVCECDDQSSTVRRSWPIGGCRLIIKKIEICKLNFSLSISDTKRYQPTLHNGGFTF
jgi:hypothetical protein